MGQERGLKGSISAALISHALQKQCHEIGEF